MNSKSIGFFKFHGYGISRIQPRLYLSGEDVAKSLQTLKEHKITHILNLTTNVENLYEPRIVYKRLRVNDTANQDMSECFNESIKFIDNALEENEQNFILVHCNAGVSRSAAVIIAYLLHKKLFTSYKNALDFVVLCRPIVCPNNGFVQQLKQFEAQINSKL